MRGLDTQMTIGAIAGALALGFIAHDHGWLASIWRNVRGAREWPSVQMRVSKRWRFK